MGAVNKAIYMIFILLVSFTASTQQMNWTKLSEDTVYYANEYLPDHFTITPPGPGQIWDLRSVRAPYAISRRIIPTGEKDNVSYGHLMNGKEAEAILILNGKFSSIAQYVEDNPLCPGRKLNFVLTPAKKAFFHGILGSSQKYNGKMQASFAWPRDMVCNWKPQELPDSCRITYMISEEITVDGEGMLYLPSEINNVYRHRVEEKKTLRVETKKGKVWKDVTSIVPGLQLIQYTEMERYVSANSGLPLTEIEIRDEMNLHRIEFKTHPLVTRIFAEEPSKPDIFAYPNPSFDIVRFQLSDLLYGRYKLKIFNILGVPVKETEVQVDDPRETISIDLSDLQRGTYLYRLQDNFGRTIRTKRLVLIQP